jgi:transcriptional regulator with XRE-family HTH domain
MAPDNRLGEFLRARRELTSPAEHGLPDLGRRRVPGLRREEVATLAGISTEYYVRLERGVDRHPSAQVTAALARVFELDPDSTAYLVALATDAPGPRPETPGGEPGCDTVAPGTTRMLEAMAGVPAFALNRYLDVLAYNRLAEIVHGGPPAGGVGGNVVRHVFLDPHARDLYPDWHEVAAEATATLRASTGSDANDARLERLVGELSVRSAHFAELWARHDVRAKSSGRKTVVAPGVGDLTFQWEALSVASTPGQLLVAYFAEPGSRTERFLRRLSADSVHPVDPRGREHSG